MSRTDGRDTPGRLTTRTYRAGVRQLKTVKGDARYCAASGCGTRLSVYNFGDCCDVHTPRRRRRRMWL